MAMPDASYNFEYDMELLEALPLEADIPFYDAWIDKQPDPYAFSVAGSDTITGWDGANVNCWLVTADYKTGESSSVASGVKKPKS